MSSSSINLSSLLKVAGDDIIRAYRTKYFTTGIIEASGDFLSNKNAINWVNAENFQHFVVKWLQVPTPCTPQIIESSTSASALPLRQYKRQRGSSTSSEHSVSEIGSRKSDIGYQISKHPGTGRNRSSEYPPPITWVTPNKSTGTPAKKHARYSKHQAMTDAGWIQITCQQWVKQLVELTEIPMTWPIPMEGESIGYILDLTNSAFKFIDSNGNPLSMAAIIKNKCVDGWGDGSGGTKDAGPVVFPLGKIKTQRAIHVCRGHFMCSRVDSSLFFKYERYSDDFKTFEEIHNAQMANNAAEADSVIGVAAAVAFQTCKFNDGKCKGQPIIQTFERMTAFGKDQFIGCSARQPAEDKHAHIFFSIPLHVSQSTLNDIFTTQGSTSRDTEKYTVYYLAHVHFENGKLLNGLITWHQCPAQIIIYTPIDHSIRKAVVITTPGLPHNHPPYALQKLTFEATELYVEAIEAVGLLGSTVGQIDRAPTTKALLASQKATDSKATSSLTRHRVKQRILSGMKQKQYPEGKDIAGVKHIYENIELKQPVQERYIQSMHSELCNDGNDQIDIVVTMLPDLAELVHSVTSTQHDTTYKRIFGAFNEWEIAYRLIWTEWFKAIEHVTNKSVKFKALHKEGKHAIFMVDGSAPQMQGLGDFLLTQNDPLVSRIATKDPQIIVQYCSRICNIHCQRGFEPLKAEKMDEFTAWCLGHEQPKVRDWWRNKLVYPWYIPALCRHFSKVPSADWDLGPTNTNLNEQSHQIVPQVSTSHLQRQLIDFTGTSIGIGKLHLDEPSKHNHTPEVTNIEINLAAALEEKKIAIENVNQLRTEKKQVSGGKKINLKASGRGFPTPAVAISTEKENFPFPSLSLPSSSYHPTSAEPFYASLPPELEPPTSTEPFYASLPPELEPPPSSYNIHLSYLQQSRLYTNSEPVFPSATCPPNLRSNQ
ncbi:hypothetical protein BU17DRAFT_90642 [Hysterangium stoloniferum]|nr:hypothetical protein BU17DRAFT_90642 [Hysterangium stoloniferum]